MQNIGRMFKGVGELSSTLNTILGLAFAYFMHSRTYYVMVCSSGVTLENLF